MTHMLRPHIVILGAGFGGTYVGKKLARLAKIGEIDLTIVNRTNYFLFTPLLHEVATGSLSPRSVAEPLREVFVHECVRIIQGSVDSIDLEKQTVKIAPLRQSADGGGPNTAAFSIEYDYLVIATGAETNHYGIPGAERLTLPLKSLADAARIRNRIIDSFEAATLTTDPTERARLLSFAVVGGGPTGVEVASELAELVSGMVKRYFDERGRVDVPHSRRPSRSQNMRNDYFKGENGPDGGRGKELNDPAHCSPEEPEITLIDSGPEILSMFDQKLRKKAAERLTSDGVSIRQNTKVVEVTPQGLALGDGSMLSAGTVIWAAGVKPIIPRFEGDSQPELFAGRLAVNEHFQLKGQSKVFVLGDAAGYVDAHASKAIVRADPDKHSDKDSPIPSIPAMRALPQSAQVAVSEARVVAHNIQAAIQGKELKGLHFHSKGSMVSVGQWFAVGEILSLKISGPLTWWLWRTVYLFKFASSRKRVRIALEWAFELVSPRDITKM